MIRAALNALAAGKDPALNPDPPAGAVQLRCPVVVTLRRGGYVVGVGQVDRHENGAAACCTAALHAAKNNRLRTRLTADILKRLSVEVELIGPPGQLRTRSSNPDRLARQYCPGLDGVAVRLAERKALIRPSQIVALGFSTTEALEFVHNRLGLTPDELRHRRREAVYLRFRTRHFWQAQPDGPVVELHRGCALIQDRQVTAKRLDDAVLRIARYLQNRQRRDGSFTYAYLPYADERKDAAPAIAEAGAAWALARYAAEANRPEAAAAARRTIDALSRRLAAPIDAGPSRAETRGTSPAYLRSPEQADRLGATALLLLAAADVQPAGPYRTLRDRLAAGILTLQRPTGMMQANFVTTRSVAPQDTDPGLALLALARYYDLDRRATILAALDNGFSHYHKQFEVSPSVALVAWSARAYARLATTTGQRRYVEAAFGMVDWLEPCQLTADNCDRPLMHGGIDPRGYELAGITTAVHMAAVADALALARHRGDKDRARRYADMLRRGTRFVLQLHYRPEECYYSRSRLETLDGVRATPWDHTLTIDNCQHALIALMEARRHLFGRQNARNKNAGERDVINERSIRDATVRERTDRLRSAFGPRSLTVAALKRPD